MADEPDLDAMAERLRTAAQLDADERAELVLTLAEHHDRRVIAPLIDLLASRRADELLVRAAGWFADPALHPALVDLAASRIGDLGDPGYWEQVDRAIARCHPGALEAAEQIEVTVLATAQTSLLESGAAEVEVSLDGAYPTTEVVLRLGDHQRRHAIWNFDETNPDDPTSVDLSFTLFRVGTLARWG